jgi:hypothetical protein
VKCSVIRRVAIGAAGTEAKAQLNTGGKGQARGGRDGKAAIFLGANLFAKCNCATMRGDMNRQVKSLPLKQVKEIFVVLRNLETMAHELGRDVERGSRELSANSSDQFLRRNLVRIFASFVEGSSFLLKQVVLRLHDPLQEHFSIEEMSKLKEIKLNPTGEPVLDAQGIPKRCHLPLHDNLKFTGTIFGRLCGSKYAVSYGSAGHQAFKRTISVRDRLMHPKAVKDLLVTNDETMDLQAAWQWHQTEMVALLNDSNSAINTRFAAILQMNADGSSHSMT